jgi:hypothetical protein
VIRKTTTRRRSPSKPGAGWPAVLAVIAGLWAAGLVAGGIPAVLIYAGGILTGLALAPLARRLLARAGVQVTRAKEGS